MTQLIICLLIGPSDEAEIATRDNESHLPPNSIPSQPRNPSNQFLAPNQFMQVRFGL